MKNLMLFTFCGLLLISSCTCNEGKEDADMDNQEMNDGTANDANSDMNDNNENMNDASGSSSTDWNDERFSMMFDRNNYTEEQVAEYRRMHDEQDWGNVPGYYPEASTRPLTVEDTKYLTDWGHNVMLNEIYARHGKVFSDPDLKAHFNTQGWYNAQHNDVQDMLTQQEKENIAFLMNHQPS